MEEWLMFIAKDTVTIIEAMALVEIAIGMIVAFFSGNPAMLRPSAADTDVRHIWQRYARWLVAGLTFQLAVDIVKTTIMPSWADIGQVAAIAVIRTFPEYCLMRDLSEVSGRRCR